jgi:hypothetical protein
LKYNERRRFDLLRQYKESVEKGDVTNVGFIEYEKVTKEVQRKIIGVQTYAGVAVRATSQHLIDRIIGSEAQKRAGVSINKTVDTLENGFCDGEIKTNPQGQRSVAFVKDDVYVSFNIDENKVVQCRPRGKKEIKKYGR